MPNTGRFCAAPSTTAYRERYMRPYSTVSHPMGGVPHAMNTAAVPPKGVMPPAAAAYTRSSASMRRQAPDSSEEYAPYSSAYESRIRSRPAPMYEDDRQFARPRAWSEEEEERVSVHRGAPLSSSGPFRSIEMSRQQRVASASIYEFSMGIPTRASFDSAPLPSTLPCLSSLLKRSSMEDDNYESEDPFMTRKRAREASPPKDDVEHQPKTNRRFYEDYAFTDRRAPAKYSEEDWGARGENRAQDSMRTARRDMTIQAKNPRSYVNTAHQSLAHNNQPSPVSSFSRQLPEHLGYPYVRDEISMPTRSSDHTRRPSVAHREKQPAARSDQYEQPTRAYEMQQQRNYYVQESQRIESSPVALNSPLPTAIARDRFSPVRRYSESKEADCVIEAAADLVEERSPSKRESITKLLLKSKDFLKAKSLVRNRNNEIDWVATFLNVGFESNSIYSLMCPLRKGRWKVEEEKYTMELLRLIESGTIRLRHGQSIRGFIAKKLHSDDMRVLKKLSNCKMFHFARLINPRMSDEEEVDKSIPNVRSSLDRLDKLKAEFLRSVQLEALVAVRKYLSDTSIRDLLNARD